MHADSTSYMFSYLEVIFMSVAWGVFMNVRDFIIDAITVTRLFCRALRCCLSRSFHLFVS